MARFTIPQSEWDRAILQDGSDVEAVYLAPSINICNADQIVYDMIRGKLGIAAYTPLLGSTLTGTHERVSTGLSGIAAAAAPQIWRARFVITKSGRLADYLPRNASPCGSGVPYQLSAVHVLGARNVISRGSDNLADLAEKPSETLGAAAENAAELVADALRRMLGILAPVAIPAALFVAWRLTRK